MYKRQLYIDANNRNIEISKMSVGMVTGKVPILKATMENKHAYHLVKVFKSPVTQNYVLMFVYHRNIN